MRRREFIKTGIAATAGTLACTATTREAVRPQGTATDVSPETRQAKYLADYGIEICPWSLHAALESPPIETLMRDFHVLQEDPSAIFKSLYQAIGKVNADPPFRWWFPHGSFLFSAFRWRAESPARRRMQIELRRTPGQRWDSRWHEAIVFRHLFARLVPVSHYWKTDEGRQHWLPWGEMPRDECRIDSNSFRKALT